MKIAKLESLCAVIACLLMCQIQDARANAIITNKGPGTDSTIGDFTTLGYDFAVGSAPLLVTSLGLWDQNQDGFTNGHTLGLWDNAGNLLATAAILPGTVDPLSGEFRYATLATSVTLMAGTTYVLGATYVDQDADHFILNVGGNQATFHPARSISSS
jgi:hypothetical protein